MKLTCSKNQQVLIAENLRFAKRFVSHTLPPVLLEQLRELTRNFSLSLKSGDLLLLSSGWYVTHAGLVRLAKRCHCCGMQVQPVRQLSDQARWLRPRKPGSEMSPDLYCSGSYLGCPLRGAYRQATRRHAKQYRQTARTESRSVQVGPSGRCSMLNWL